MCRLLGVVASEPAVFRLWLHEAPRSLATLSRAHKDGWGIAVRGDQRDEAWRIHRGVESAHADDRFHEVAGAAQGSFLVAHVRRRTVGPLALENTHPFSVGRWVFAHNGTIEELDWLRAETAPERLAAVRGSTDSELFLAWLLTRLDEAGLGEARASDVMDRAIADALRSATRRPGAGAITFLLSDGEVIYAHRHGRTLHVLERRPGDPVRTVRESSEGVALGTLWTPERHAVLLASEALTDEPWSEVPEHTLVRVDRSPRVSARVVGATG